MPAFFLLLLVCCSSSWCITLGLASAEAAELAAAVASNSRTINREARQRWPSFERRVMHDSHWDNPGSKIIKWIASNYDGVAVCLYGRAQPASLASILDNFATPLTADVFASVSLSEHTLAMQRQFVNGMDRSHAQVPHESEADDLLAQLNRTGRLVRYDAHHDSDDDLSAMRAHLNGSTVWRRFGIWGFNAYLDWMNRARCLGSIAGFESHRKQRYAFVGQCRLDIFLFSPLPVSITTSMSSLSAAPKKWLHIPVGDDNPPGVIDILSVGTRNAAMQFGKAGHSATLDTKCLQQKFSQWDEERLAVYPESLAAAALICTSVTVTRFEWPHCRVDESGACRYPGEVSRLLKTGYVRPSSSTRPENADANRTCALMLPEASIGKAVAKACSSLAANDHPVRNENGLIFGVKGSASCLTNFGDIFCCKAQRRCAAIMSKEPTIKPGLNENSNDDLWEVVDQLETAYVIPAISVDHTKRQPVQGGTFLVGIATSGHPQNKTLGGSNTTEVKSFPVVFWVNVQSHVRRKAFMENQFHSNGITANRVGAWTKDEVIALIRASISNSSWAPTDLGETPFARDPSSMSAPQREAYAVNPQSFPCEDQCITISELRNTINHILAIKLAHERMLARKMAGAVIMEDDAEFVSKHWTKVASAPASPPEASPRVNSRDDSIDDANGPVNGAPAYSPADALSPYLKNLGLRGIVQLLATGPERHLDSLSSHGPGVRVSGFGSGITAYYATVGCMQMILETFGVWSAQGKSTAATPGTFTGPLFDIITSVRRGPFQRDDLMQGDYPSALFGLCTPFSSSRPLVQKLGKGRTSRRGKGKAPIPVEPA